MTRRQAARETGRKRRRATIGAVPHDRARVWRLQGACNFRDLGGYPGHGGRTLRWRMLFRSDQLGSLTDADRSALAELGLTKALDLRGEAERAAMPYELPGVTQHSLPIEPTVLDRIRDSEAAGTRITASVAAELMRETYRALVSDQGHRYAELFDHLLQSDAPLVIHCTAGKDRTGVAAALILLALGVRRELVVADYLLTNELFRGHAPQLGASDEALAVLWQVQEGFLEAALQAIEDDYGGVEGYLMRRLGMTAAALARLAERYLADGPTSSANQPFDWRRDQGGLA
jgi:protein-tyrosine phosphatase